MRLPPLWPCVGCSRTFYSRSKVTGPLCPVCRDTTRKPRVCLECARTFASSSASERVCGRCRRGWEELLRRYDHDWGIGDPPAWARENEGEEDEGEYARACAGTNGPRILNQGSRLQEILVRTRCLPPTRP